MVRVNSHQSKNVRQRRKLQRRIKHRKRGIPILVDI